MRKTVILGLSVFCLLSMLCLFEAGNFLLIPSVQAATYTEPYTPINYNVLIIGAYNTIYTGSGMTHADFARYGFNMTYSYADTIDFTSDSNTADLSQYDVVFVQGLSNLYSPVRVTEAEIDHFVNYDGILILNNIALLAQDAGGWWGLNSLPVQKIETRMGIDYTGYSPIKNATFDRVNSTIAGLPSTFNGTFESGFYYAPSFNLNGASLIYNITQRTEAARNGISYYENATGAVGIYINYVYTYDDSGVPLGISGIGEDVNILRAQMLHALIAFAKEQTFGTIISPQNMAMWRYDDITSSEPYSDSGLSNALSNLYNATVANPFDPDGTNYGIVPNVALVEGTVSGFPNTLALMQELESIQAVAVESHFGHEDYRIWSVAQINTQWDIDETEWETLGLNPFSYLIVPHGGDYSYVTANMLSIMSSRGYYILDLGFDTNWDWHVNDSIIVRGTYNIGNYQNFTEKSTMTIYSNYRQVRNWMALAISNGGVQFYSHPPPFQFNEVGVYWIYTIATNFTDQMPVEWVAGYEWGLYAPSYKWATVSSPSQSGSTITFTLNVDNVPSIVTIGKGMAWLRIDAGNTIASVTVDGSPWHVFDDYTIKVPATNSQIQVTLGTPTTPYIKESDRKITSTLYISNKLTFIVDSLDGIKSITKVYCGNRGKPVKVKGADLASYYSVSKILTVQVTHSGPEEITIHWQKSKTNPNKGS